MTRGQIFREAVGALDPELPDLQFRSAMLGGCGDMLDAWEAELEAIRALPPDIARVERSNFAHMTLARIVSALLTGTVGYEPTKEAYLDFMAVVTLALVMSEEYIQQDLRVTREMLDAATEAFASHEDEKPVVH